LIKSDLRGDYFFRPFNAKGVGIESWEVFLPSEGIVREVLKTRWSEERIFF
jgi:hypothetical protein